MLKIKTATKEFSDWQGLLKLLRSAFAYQQDRIDPPSSLSRFDEVSIAKKANEEVLFLATEECELVGCIFAKPEYGSLYVGKFAVWPHHQGKGVGRRLMQRVEDFARHKKIDVMELETRIELTENHAAFTSLGFVKTGEHSHDGYEKPTFISMKRLLRG